MIMEARLPVRLVILTPVVENAIAGDAMRGRLTDVGLEDELRRTRLWLAEAKQPHFDEFLAAWK
jgi:hypothetical protein